jgi:hypothetical protein
LSLVNIQTYKYLDLLEWKNFTENEPIHVQLGQQIVSILVDILYKFGTSNMKKLEDEALIFFKIITNGNVVKTANGLVNLLDFLITQKIKLHESDIEYIKEEIYSKYIKVKVEQLLVPEKVEISEESKLVNAPDHSDLLLKIEERLAKLQSKPDVAHRTAVDDFEEITDDRISDLKKGLHEFVSDGN